MTLTPADCVRNLAHVRACQTILEQGATDAQVEQAEAILARFSADPQAKLPLAIAV